MFSHQAFVGFHPNILFSFFLSEAGVRKFLLELVDTTSGIHKLHLASEEGVAVARYLKLDEGVLVAILPGNRVLGLSAGAAQERVSGREILENNGAIAIGMNIFFHGFFFSFLKRNAKIGFLSL